ncbi:response regulator [Parasphingopyxis sp. CP4]|uniref:response regulator n=1 Tax=Parasphingopyxis sp. CP4 TaxID=2724527 RepID=UPI0015A4B7EF|nr:response regulator [Parasphingopyxis sp. CP4]QLC20721.1 response regulator [Parasphingopyxis sp. CP4]
MSSLGQQLAPHLTLLRRFARALTGDQAQGDAYVRLTLESIVDTPDAFPSDVEPRTGLYRSFLKIWARADTGPVDGPDDTDSSEAIANARLAMIDKVSRQALLLSEVEGFTQAEIGYLLDRSVAEIDVLIGEAKQDIEAQLKTDVLIIEDEPIIAMDIESIVRDLGHDVSGIAVTRDEAVAQAGEHRPGLVLADIQLADDSSGIDAVQDILAKIDVPVIFITAFPERLLTGERPEPAFLITKPFQHSTVKTAIAQALFFNRATVPA